MHNDKVHSALKWSDARRVGPLTLIGAKRLIGACLFPALVLMAHPPSILAQTPLDMAKTAMPISHLVAERLAREMESSFVYPEIGKTYASALRAKAQAGAYDTLAGTQLARALTADLLSIYPDGHVRVISQNTSKTSLASTQKRKSLQATEMPYWLTSDIAYIRFNAFPGGGANAAAITKFAGDFANARVIIFDLRGHGGGGLDEMDTLFPLLFSKATPLVRMATRKSVFDTSGSPFAASSSLVSVDGDPAYVTHEHWAKPAKAPLLGAAKVYVLTSRRTASAAEHFALAIKSSGRGILVGSRTAGANHFGAMADLGHGYAAFVPVGRTFDPATGKDWEGTGVAPDIETPAKDALKAVMEREGTTYLPS